MKKPLIDLLQFSHNRKNSFLFETDELIKIIDKFIDQDNLDNLFNHFYYAYGLPKEVTKRKFKRFIATSYIYKKSSFNNKLRLNIHLKYYQGKNVISGIKVVSKPGRRFYKGVKNVSSK